MRKQIAGRMVLMLAGMLLYAVRALAGQEDPSALVRQAVGAARQKNFSQALSLANRAVKLAPKQVEVWVGRAQVYEAKGDYTRAISDVSQALKLNPKEAGLWQARGETYFRVGKITESIADFDRVLKLAPEQKPYHWQRGISLYYAGRFAEGKQQFELHQTVNSQDVENAVWHFLCTARAEGLESAKKQLIPIDADARVPMAQVHQLFAGKATPKEVLAAAQAAPAQTRAGEPLFYAHLYLGLYYEAIGDSVKAKESIFKAAERARENGYMGDVARVHADILRPKGKGRRPEK